MSGDRLKLFNVKMPEPLIADLRRLAKAADMTPSAWVRHLVELAVHAGGIGPMRRASVALELGAIHERDGGSLAQVEPSGCVHPTPARQRTAFAVVCGLCGATVRSTL